MKELTIRPSMAIGLCILFGGAFTFIVIAILSGMTWAFDGSVTVAIQGFESPWLTSIMIAFAFIGSTKVVFLITIAVTVLLIWRFGARSQAYFFFFTMIGTIISFQPLKVFYKRDRPVSHQIIEASGYSFPSGHAMMGFSLYALITFLLWQHVQSTVGRGVLVAFSIFMFGMICIGRVYLGVHYPSDVLGGVFASGFWVTLTTILFVQFQKRKARSLVHD